MFTTIACLASTINAACALYGWHRSSKIANANARAFKLARMAKHITHARRIAEMRLASIEWWDRKLA